jgi:hypothetical protein
MKKTLFLLIVLLVSSTTYTSGQFLKDLKKKANEVIPLGSSLSQEEVGRGLKEALNKGIEKGVTTVSKSDGYFKDPIIKILMPEEAKGVVSKLRGLGQGKLVDDAIESMNRAAEDAAKGALNIFVDAIKAMTIKDAMNILKGEDDAATQYLSKSTRTQLTAKFLPVIKVSLDKVGATKHWKSLMSTYNKIPFVKKVNPNLEEYVTDKAISGLFVQVAKEEKEIRSNPAARTTELLKKVFSN